VLLVGVIVGVVLATSKSPHSSSAAGSSPPASASPSTTSSTASRGNPVSGTYTIQSLNSSGCNVALTPGTAGVALQGSTLSFSIHASGVPDTTYSGPYDHSANPNVWNSGNDPSLAAGTTVSVTLSTGGPGTSPALSFDVNYQGTELDGQPGDCEFDGNAVSQTT
jgi:hypothetical protein